MKILCYGFGDIMTGQQHYNFYDISWNRNITISMLLLKTRALYLGDSNRSGTHNHLVDKRTQAFSQTGQMIDLYCEYLSVRCILLYVIMSRTSFGVNLQYIVCLNVKELLARSRCHI